MKHVLCTALVVSQVIPSIAFVNSSFNRFSTKTIALHESHACSDRSNFSGANHRHSSKDWMHNLASLPKSTVLREIANPILSVTIWATFLSILHHKFSACPSFLMQRIARNMCVSGEVHKFLASSLSLLLVFRTNSAYQRFVVSQVSVSIIPFIT